MSDKNDLVIKFETESSKKYFMELFHGVIGISRPDGETIDFESDNYGQTESKSINKDEVIIR